MTEVLEVVEFYQTKQSSKEGFLAAAQKALSFAKSLEGFISTELAQDGDGKYINVVKWRDMECAKSAAQNFMTYAEVQDFISVIDPEGMKMHHYEIDFEIKE